jgi:hypothetical protein
MIKKLIAIDLYFNRLELIALTCLGFMSIALLSAESESLFYVGLVLLISSIVIVGALLIFRTVIYERKNKTLVFTLSLPMSYMNYTVAKLAANLSAFVLVWMLLVAGVIGTILFREHLPNGLIPYFSIVLLELLIGYIAVLATALISESEAWTITVMSITNVGVSLFMFWAGSISGIKEHIEGPVAVWNSSAVTMLGGELIIGCLIIGATLYIQSRKTDFL